MLQRIAGDSGDEDGDGNGGHKADDEETLLGGGLGFRRSGSRLDTCFADDAEVYVHNSSRQGPQPAGEKIWDESDTREAVEVVAEVEGDCRAEAKEEDDFSSLLANSSVDGSEFRVLSGPGYDPVPGDISRDEKGESTTDCGGEGDEDGSPEEAEEEAGTKCDQRTGQE